MQTAAPPTPPARRRAEAARASAPSPGLGALFVAGPFRAAPPSARPLPAAMASDSDPRLKRRRGGRLSNQQVAAFAALGVVILLATAAYYSEVLWEIEHVRKAHAYVSDKVRARW